MRNTKIVKIKSDDKKNRDAGKTFLITEMPASQAERWGARVFQALMRGGFDVPEDMKAAGMAGLAKVGMRALGNIPYHDAQDLLDEMFSCIKIVRDPSQPDMSFPLMEEDIEEVATRLYLRTEVFELHTGFSIADSLQKSMGTSATNPPKE